MNYELLIQLPAFCVVGREAGAHLGRGKKPILVRAEGKKGSAKNGAIRGRWQSGVRRCGG